MSDITLSSAVRSNLLNLQNTADLLGKTQERLATGKEVNSALDNPTNFFTASSLNSRASDLSRLLDSVSNATQTLEAADNGISAITSLVESAQASARQALQASGQVVESKVVGATSASFNPEALTSITGDNSATGTNTGAVTADAPASVDTASIAADTAQADFDFDTADLGDNTTVLDAIGGTPIADGDIIELTVNGTTTSIEFADDGVGTGTSDITIDRDLDDVADFAAAIDGITGISASATDGVISIETDAGTDTVKFGNSVGTALTGLAITGPQAGTVDGSGDTVFSRNADLQELVAAGDTLQVSLGGSNVGTVSFGEAGVSSKADLITALNNFSGLDATGTATAGGVINLTPTDSSDADSAIALTGSDNNALETVLGFTPDTVGGTVSTTEGTNLISQSAVVQGDTLNIKIGASAQLDITFGTGSGQVSTLAELNSTLQGIAGGSASVDTRGELNVTTNNAGETITLGGTASALAAFGQTAGEASSLIDGTNIADGDKLTFQIGTNNALTVEFGTGSNQVNTVDELEDALGNLAGGKAEIDGTTGAITIEATQGTDSISITSTNSLDASKDAVAGAFGLNQGVTTSTTTDSTTRSDLRSQFNELLVQIDELAEDSGFNGVNLLDGDDLKVIFNEDGSSTLDIEGVTFDSSSLGLSRQSTGAFQSDVTIEATLDTLDTVIGTLRSQASQFGSNLSVVETREDFTKNTINTLETGAANLTLADTNAEGANLLALQTRQSLSTTALSLSSQADQNVLRLF